MQHLNRQNRLLNEAIDALDHRLREAKGDEAKAWTLLTPLELEFIKEEIALCVTDRPYYLQNYHVIQPETGDPRILFPLMEHQWEVEELIQRLRKSQGWSKVMVLKPRQSGMTEYSVGVMAQATFFTPHAYTVSVAQDPQLAGFIQRKINLCWEKLPWWMRPERQYISKGEYLEYNRKDEFQRLADPGLASVWATTHADRETSVAVGRTIRNLHMSELCWWKSGETFTADIEPTMNAPDTNAIAESTGLHNYGFWYNWWHEAREDPDCDWTPIFLAAYKVKKYFRAPKADFKPTEDEQALVDKVKKEENIDISNGFLFWRRVKIRSTIRRDGSPYAFFASYPCTEDEAFQSDELGAFPRHKLDWQALHCVRTPTEHGEILFQGREQYPLRLLESVPPGTNLPRREDSNRLWIWEHPDPNEAYYLSGDVSLGNGGDFSALEVFRAGRGFNPDVQVAEWLGWIEPTELAKIAYALGFYYNHCEAAIEYEKEGMTTANYLNFDLEYPNLYRPMRRDRITSQMTNYVHWETNSKTKPLIITTMREALLSDTVVIRSRDLLDQLRKFVAKTFDENDQPISYGGESGSDDACMAALIGLFCLRDTMPERRASINPVADPGDGARGARGAKPSAGAVIYGVYDQFTRLVSQTRNLAEAEAMVKKNPGFGIKPIIVSKANTAYSLIHHGTGPESDLYRRLGVDSWDITPGRVQEYVAAGGRGALPPGDQEDWGAIMSGDDWGRE